MKLVSSESLKEAIKIIKSGGVIIFPTETVYGIGASVGSKEGIKRIYKIKKRPKDKPLAVLISNFDQLHYLVKEVPPHAQKLIKKYWPGPLTLILKKKGGGKIGVRMPDHKVPLKLIDACGPIAATSANISGEKDPVSPEEIQIEADLILDSGKCREKAASTVIDATGLKLKVLRGGRLA